MGRKAVPRRAAAQCSNREDTWANSQWAAASRKTSPGYSLLLATAPQLWQKKKPHWTDCAALSAQICYFSSPWCYAVSWRHKHNNTSALKMLLKSEHCEWRWAKHSLRSRHEVKLWCSDLPCFVNRGKSYIPRQWDKSAKQGLVKSKELEEGLKTVFSICLQYLNTILVSNDPEIKGYILCFAKT